MHFVIFSSFVFLIFAAVGCKDNMLLAGTLLYTKCTVRKMARLPNEYISFCLLSFFSSLLNRERGRCYYLRGPRKQGPRALLMT